jgi:hypothetical protein
MTGVFQNIDPPPPHHPASVYPPSLVRGEDTLAGWRGGSGSIFWKTSDTALYSTYVSTLCLNQTKNGLCCLAFCSKSLLGHTGNLVLVSIKYKNSYLTNIIVPRK